MMSSDRSWRGRAKGIARFTFFFALPATLTAFVPITAQAQSSSEQAAAEALFKQGRDLMAAGQYGEACPKLVESERLDPAPGTLLNLATCYEKNGQVASAWVTYKEAATAAHKADQSERARMAHDKAAELEPSLPTLTIVVPAAADVPELQVRRDGELVGRPEWGAAIPLDPGVHAIEARAPGRKVWQGQAPIAGIGTKASLEIPVLEQLPEAPPEPGGGPGGAAAAVTGSSLLGESVALPPPPSHPGATQRAAAWVVGGVGLAGVAAGAVFGIIANSDNKSAADNDCFSTVCTAQGISSTSDAKNAATVSTIAFAAGGGLVAVGIVLWLTAPSDKHRTAGSIRLAPLVAPDTGGALIAGSF